MNSLWKRPSAWVPVVLSLCVLLMELGYLLFAGPPQRQADEGVTAHLFQFWLAAEFFLILFFAFTWLSREPKAALRVLAIQIVAVLAGMFPVFYFHL